jgi:hypothetical protein
MITPRTAAQITTVRPETPGSARAATSPFGVQQLPEGPFFVMPGQHIGAMLGQPSGSMMMISPS